MTGPRYTPLVDALPATVPFVGPETLERRSGTPFRARLGANENVFGPSPKAIEAMARAARDVWMYGDPENHDLKEALAAYHGLRPENVVVGEGIDGLLGYLARLVIAPGDAVVTSEGAYPTFNFHVAGCGGVLHKVPYRQDHEDPAALVALAATLRPKLIYLANPDNPMASHHPGRLIEQMVEALPDGTLLVLDEAYVELAPEGTAARIAAEDPRVIRMRTFSKAYGMAGARVGYALAAAPLARAFDKVRNHFGMSRIAQAGALAALADTEWLEQTRRNVGFARERIGAIAAANGLHALPSATNFVAIDSGGEGALARRIVAELGARGVFIRMPGVAPLDRCIRISAGRPADLDLLEEVLPGALDAARESVTPA